MPTNEYGEHADICLNPTGVVGRENIEQLYEHEMNFIADHVERESKKIDDIEEKFAYIMSYYKIIETKLNKQYKMYTRKWKKASPKKKQRIIDDIYKHHLYTHEPPFYHNSSIETLCKLYETFGYHPYKMTVKGQPIEEPLIMADLYYIRLKHDPKSKISARSSGDININNIPSKSSSFKYHTALFSKTPVRLGEMEFNSLLLTKKIDLVTRLLAQTSNNPDERKHFNEVLLTHPNVFNIDKIERVGSKSITSEIIKTEMQAIGLANIEETTNEYPELVIKDPEEWFAEFEALEEEKSNSDEEE